LWSGSETADEGMRNNGYLEGALEASMRTVRRLID
jgi:monoamine oxidase